MLSLKPHYKSSTPWQCTLSKQLASLPAITGTPQPQLHSVLQPAAVWCWMLLIHLHLSPSDRFVSVMCCHTLAWHSLGHINTDGRGLEGQLPAVPPQVRSWDLKYLQICQACGAADV